jgi:hypothetical protein
MTADERPDLVGETRELGLLRHGVVLGSGAGYVERRCRESARPALSLRRFAPAAAGCKKMFTSQ